MKLNNYLILHVEIVLLIQVLLLYILKKIVNQQKHHRVHVHHQEVQNHVLVDNHQNQILLTIMVIMMIIKQNDRENRIIIKEKNYPHLNVWENQFNHFGKNFQMLLKIYSKLYLLVQL